MGRPFTEGLLQALLLGAALISAVGPPALAQSPRDGSRPSLDEANIKPAIDGIFDAFERSLVGLGDKHGLAQEIEFYEALIRDPRFARNVGNVVVEFGGAARQDVIDRYVNGEPVAYRELRQVWTDTVGWTPTVWSVGYANFFAQVRDVNRTLPRQQRIRVWLGEPPIVWERIQTRDELREYMRARETHAAGLLVQHILEQKKKALVIYGSQHLRRFSAEETAKKELLWTDWTATAPETAAPFALMRTSGSLVGLVEAKHSGAFFLVQVYDGFDDEACTTRFEQRMQEWPLPALAVPIRATTLESDLRRCPFTLNLTYPPVMPQALQDLLRAEDNDVFLRGDAVLFLAPAANLTESPIFPDLYLDEEYRQEISRQMEIKSGRPLPPGWGRNVPITPVPLPRYRIR
jgi:hypothetical protein